MRLTLRNMLAAMDEILEPAQQEEIKQKIEESEFATSIMHRIRDVTRRIRLGAPKLTGKGMGLDPNTVAMYLDNTLSADRVPDFEKVCLESDVHLAEVAACHQVLALVLGEPAEISPTLRQRLYDLEHGATAVVAETPAVPPPLIETSAVSARRERPRIPDYLRDDHRSKWWAVAATILLAILLGGAVVAAIGVDRTMSAVARLWKTNDNQAAGNAENGEQAAANNTDADENREPAGKTGEGKESAADGDAKSANDQSKAAALTNPLDNANKSIPPDRSQPQSPDNEAAPVAPEPSINQKLDTTQRTSSIPTEPNPDNGANEGPSSPPFVLPTDTGAASTASTASAADLLNGSKAKEAATPPVDSQTNVAAKAANEVPQQPVAQPVGRFLTDTNLLLRLTSNGQWARVPQGATLNAAEQLLVLPTYRPTVTLSGGLTMQVLGETRVELLGAGPNGIPRLSVPFGRVVLMTVGKPGVSVELTLRGLNGTATFLDAGSTLAVEVRPFLPAGANPEVEKGYVAIDMYAVGGDVEWQISQNPAAMHIEAPGHLTLGTPYQTADTEESKEKQSLPDWITAEKIGSQVHVNASEDLNQALSEKNDRPVALVLHEFAEDRRWEKKNLGARSLALIGEFDPFIPALNDYDQRSVWPQQIDSLQAALARGPETAAKVREAFQKQRGAEDGWKLYRMLGGYSKADIEAGAAQDLVDYLGHSRYDFRVLAIHALRSIPGVPPNFTNYQPWLQPQELRIQLNRWRDYLRTKNSPISAEGALDRPGPAPKERWTGPAPAKSPLDPVDDNQEARRVPRSISIRR
jgi:hypothetical protein